MGIAERKARQREQLRKRVLAAAEELFVNEGYTNVSMRRIARAIEYSPTTIYRLFRDKAEIMEQLIADGYLGVYQRYQEVACQRDGDPLLALREVLTGYVNFALANPSHYRLWFETSRLEVEGGRLQMWHGDARYHVFQIWIECIEACLTGGAFEPRDALAIFQVVWGAVHGLISLRLHHRDFSWLPIDDHVRQVLDVLVSGLAGPMDSRPGPKGDRDDGR